MLTLGQAARLTGKGKTTLTRAIRAGRLSATRRDDGGYLIDPSELSRVFTVTPETVEPARRATAGDGVDRDLETRLAVAETELRALKELMAELRASRDSWQAQAERLALPRSEPEAEKAIALPGPTNRRPSWWRRVVGR